MSAFTESPDTMSYRSLDVGVTGQVISGAQAKMYSYYFTNQDAAVTIYLKFYDKATAATSADTPKKTIPLFKGTSANVLLGGWKFTLGISVRATTGIADNDTGAPTANDCVLNIEYLQV